MPFPMRIQPIDPEAVVPYGLVAAKPPVVKSRLKRLFERQFPGVLSRTSSSERIPGVPDGKEREKDAGGDLEPSSVCLAKMVQNFLEENNEKPSRCGRSRCNCFNGNCDDSSDDEFDVFFDSTASAPLSAEASEILKSLVPCASTVERNLLAYASKLVERNKVKGGKDDCCRRVVAEGLVALGYDAGVCKSRWDKCPSFPAGEYEYVDVIVDGGERVIIDVDFRSEFEIARSTKSYKAVLQALPCVFVGKADRMQQIVAVVSEAAKQSLKKKGLHIPPWRKPEYMRSKWLAPHQRSPIQTPSPEPPVDGGEEGGGTDGNGVNDRVVVSGSDECDCFAYSSGGLADELDLRLEKSGESRASDAAGGAEAEKVVEVAMPPVWQPPAVLPKAAAPRGAKVVTGLASLV